MERLVFMVLQPENKGILRMKKTEHLPGFHTIPSHHNKKIKATWNWLSGSLPAFFDPRSTVSTRLAFSGISNKIQQRIATTSVTILSLRRLNVKKNCNLEIKINTSIALKNKYK